MIKKIIKNNAGFFIVLISILLVTPTLTVIAQQKEINSNQILNNFYYSQDISYEVTKTIDNARFVPFEDITMVGDQNDIGYNTDAGNNIFKGLNFPVYVGETIDEHIPGRGRTAMLEPGNGDSEDWYSFSACNGQSIESSLITNENFDFEIADPEGNPLGQIADAEETGKYFFHVIANEGANSGDYSFSITINGQNDAGINGDAGDNIGEATSISSGSYYGYMDINDQEDWYSFSVNSGQGIFVTLEIIEKSDYDIHLYNPSGELVHSSQYYGDDELEYPADVSGIWKIQLDMFPGWDASKWPDDYLLYGSGVYEFELSIGGSAEASIIWIRSL